MKIEIGESLMLSYLKHVKKCIFYQTNWKVSSKWYITPEALDKVKSIYDRIIKHSEFADIFKTELNQLIKQAEIDVIGLDSNDCVYTGDIAFHEAGLNYGDKIETKNRVIKKLLRSYLTLVAYFPNKKYELLFASPKVNLATEIIISDSFSVLQKDFTDDYVIFKYISNNNFYENILKQTILDSTNDSDTNELFIRSIILKNLFESKKQTINDINIYPKNLITDKPSDTYVSPQSNNTIEQFDHKCIIEYVPDKITFREKLLKHHKANYTLIYNDGHSENGIWYARKITKGSSISGNIRSGYLRDWKIKGIKKGIFEVKDI